MKVGYTEFSYGYAFTENLIRSSVSAPAGAPVFPNLVQEAKVGYDVNIAMPGKPMFFQFKLPEHMRRARVFELTNYDCPGLSVPFFRIGLMRKDLSDQHECLLALEKKHPRAVFYVAPFFPNSAEFNQAYNNAEVHDGSVYLSPRDIGSLPDDLVHTVAYKSGLKTAYFCSDPKPIKTLTFIEVQSLMREMLDTTVPISQSAREVKEDVLSLAPLRMRATVGELHQRLRGRIEEIADAGVDGQERIETITEMLVAREVARVGLGLELVFAQPS